MAWPATAVPGAGGGRRTRRWGRRRPAARSRSRWTTSCRCTSAARERSTTPRCCATPATPPRAPANWPTPVACSTATPAGATPRGAGTAGTCAHGATPPGPTRGSWAPGRRRSRRWWCTTAGPGGTCGRWPGGAGRTSSRAAGWPTRRPGPRPIPAGCAIAPARSTRPAACSPWSTPPTAPRCRASGKAGGTAAALLAYTLVTPVRVAARCLDPYDIAAHVEEWRATESPPRERPPSLPGGPPQAGAPAPPVALIGGASERCPRRRGGSVQPVYPPIRRPTIRHAAYR